MYVQNQISRIKIVSLIFLIHLGIVSTERLQTPRLRGELPDLWADPLGRAVLLAHRQQWLLIREHAGVLPALPGDDTRRRRRPVLDAGENDWNITIFDHFSIDL